MGFLDILRTVTGGMDDQPAHEAFGSVLQATPLGGLSGLLGQLSQGGLGEQVTTWCQGGQAAVAPELIRSALGEQHVQALAASLGVSPDEVAGHLSEHLPALAAALGERPAAT